MTLCIMCSTGMPASCLTGSCESSLVSPPEESDPSLTLSESASDGNDEDEGRWISSRGASNRGNGVRSNKRDGALKDQQSTGRKRAARLYPLNESANCEWSNRSNCGGGLVPILGCLNGKQQARHHGPDKSVSNNEEGNVHRICHYCHNRWHAANNADYDWNSTEVKAHTPIPMTDEQRQSALMDELRYKATKNKRDKRIKD